MLTVWRLAPPAFVRLLDGEGSRRAGGRWNSPGKSVVYTSSHLSLSVLELYVHLPPALHDDLPELEAVEIEVPDEAARLKITAQQFQSLMTARDPLAACRLVGDEWLSRGSSLVLQAPSVVVPREDNFMLNPTHARMKEVRTVSAEKFRFDPRLLRTGP